MRAPHRNLAAATRRPLPTSPAIFTTTLGQGFVMPCIGSVNSLIPNQLQGGTRVASIDARSGDGRPTIMCGGVIMNWDRIEGNWKQVKGKIKEQWGKLTDDDLDRIAGKRDQLVGKIQEQYGISKDEAEKQVDRFGGTIGDDDFRHYQ
jgi:uncharacterized protein YjbJ (UPF0337 family)